MPVSIPSAGRYTRYIQPCRSPESYTISRDQGADCSPCCQRYTDTLPHFHEDKSSSAASTLSQLMNSPSPRRVTSFTHPGRYFLKPRITSPTSSPPSSPPIASPTRNFPAKYSLVSSIKHSTGRNPFFPRFFVLCPLRPPCCLP